MSGDERMKFPACICMMTGLILFCLGMSLDALLLPSKHRARIRRAEWIVNLSFAFFIVSTGLLFHRVMIFCKENCGRIMDDQEASYDIRNLGDFFLGFCFGFVVHPLWLGIREGTLECLAKGTCVNPFSVSYLEFMDIVCFTPLFPRLGHDLGYCEAVGYTLPLIILTAIPVRLVAMFYRA